VSGAGRRTRVAGWLQVEAVINLLARDGISTAMTLTGGSAAGLTIGPTPLRGSPAGRDQDT